MIHKVKCHFFPVTIGACFSEKDFKKEMKAINYSGDHSFPTNGNACVMKFKGNGTYLLLCINKKKKDDLQILYPLIAHEVVHIWQFVKEHIEEEAEGAEIEAYFIQSVLQDVMIAYDRYKP